MVILPQIVLAIWKKRVIIYISSKQRKERIDMKDIKYPVYGDVDDLIFVGETWSESER